MTNEVGRYAFEDVPVLSRVGYVVAVVWRGSTILTGLEPVPGTLDRVWGAPRTPLTAYQMPRLRFRDRLDPDPSGVIQGTLFLDFNTDGVRQAGEPATGAGTVLRLRSKEDPARPTVETTVAEDGSYRFEGLSAECPEPRQIEVAVAPGPGMIQVGPIGAPIDTCRWSSDFSLQRDFAVPPGQVMARITTYWDRNRSSPRSWWMTGPPRDPVAAL